MTKTTIIMPTVNVPHNVLTWGEMLDPKRDMVIIAGNERSPHTEIWDLLGSAPISSAYLHPDGVESTQLDINAHMEPNHHHRRNFALYHALAQLDLRPDDIIVTIDDDNYPHSSAWLEEVKTHLREPNTDTVVTESSTGWYDVGRLCEPPVSHRGFPITQRRGHRGTSLQHSGSVRTMTAGHGEQIGVVASLWLGDPDIDAMERIVMAPTVTSIVRSTVLKRGTWCSFDSQATAVIAELAPMLFMWPGVGRYDDIFASYLMRAVMDPLGWHVHYGHPLVRQDRNEHDLLKDLENELFGLRNTERLCDTLRDVSLQITEHVLDGHDDMTPWGWWNYAKDRVLEECDWLPQVTQEALVAWSDDVDKLELEWL